MFLFFLFFPRTEKTNEFKEAFNHKTVEAAVNGSNQVAVEAELQLDVKDTDKWNEDLHKVYLLAEIINVSRVFMIMNQGQCTLSLYIQIPTKTTSQLFV